jgi:arginase family enzyme
MSFVFNFGFEQPGAPWNESYIAYLFAGDGREYDLGRLGGPMAVADATRYIELFEMQLGVSPGEVGVYAEMIGTANPEVAASKRAEEARSRGAFPILVGHDRRTTEACCEVPLVALWGKLGRSEADEASLLAASPSVLAGVRAATSNAFKTVPSSATILPPRALVMRPDSMREAVSKLEGPVHLSIDLDVLSPAVAQCSRSVEPGGLGWYDLIDLMDIVFQGPGLCSVDLVGTGAIGPRTSAALLCAQILMRVGSLVATGLNR